MSVAPPLDHWASPGAEALGAMGFDLRQLRIMRAQAHTVEFRLERMGFDVDILRFYGWLVAHHRNPEYRSHATGGRYAPNTIPSRDGQ